MHFKSNLVDGYRVYAVAGTNTVSFGVDFKNADTKGLLGFQVKRTYDDGSENFLAGQKIFEVHKGKVDPGKPVSTETDPIQSFVWDYFTLDAGKSYTFTFIPVKGKSDALVPQKPIPIPIKTEPTFSNKKHDIYFNRGAASSQAYARDFDNTPPDKLVGKKQQDAFAWLARDLEKAIITFIQSCKKGDTLVGAFYEFDYVPVLQEFAKAAKKGVKLKLVIDMKKNSKMDPRKRNIAAIATAKILKSNIIYREANKNELQHNKFMVRCTGSKPNPVEVFTGSTNLTESGIFGQTNVGHWIRDTNVAALYKSYWDLLSNDLGSKDTDDAATKKKDRADYIDDVMKVKGDIVSIPTGITPIFSPRKGLNMLEKYFSLIDKAKNTGDITLAFGISADLKKLLKNHNSKSPVTFMVLEKEDKPNARSTAAFYKLNAANNVYEAFGAFINDPLYNWVKETYTIKLGLGKNIAYIHSKFLIQDALGPDPVVVTGSANFSANSTTGNDENMVIIRGDKRVADIYFTEFNRLFSHFYFRAVLKQLKDSKVPTNKKSFYLDTTSSWTAEYKPNSLKLKRLMMYVNMDGV